MQFSKVIGQDKLKKQAIQEINSGKISHAKLFLGKEGYGTLPFVLAYVQYLFCKNRQENDSCGSCDSCLKITDLQHPDIHFSYPTILANDKSTLEIYPTWRENVLKTPYFDLTDWTKVLDGDRGRKPIIGAEGSIDIIKSLSLKSFEGRYRVMIIWAADEMNIVSANKLLKIIEEPPSNTFFFLIGSQQEKFLQTTLSRTQIVQVPRIETDDLSNYLRKEYGLNISTADSITIRSEGNLIDSINYIDESQQITDDRELFIELMRTCYKKDVNLMLDWCDKIGEESRDRQKNFLQYCLHMFRQSLLKNYTEDALLRVSDEEGDFLKKFARFITGNNILHFNDTFNKAHYYLDRNANPKIVFTNICFNVMRYIHVA